MGAFFVQKQQEKDLFKEYEKLTKKEQQDFWACVLLHLIINKEGNKNDKQ